MKIDDEICTSSASETIPELKLPPAQLRISSSNEHTHAIQQTPGSTTKLKRPTEILYP